MKMHTDPYYSDSAAARAGLQQGDLVQKINGKRVATLSALRRMKRQTQDQTLHLQIVRDQKSMPLEITP